MNRKELIDRLIEAEESNEDSEVIISNDNGTQHTVEEIRWDNNIIYIDVIEKFGDRD